ncbi:hypothetical protein [Geodermatophilus sp. SYSU D01176]
MAEIRVSQQPERPAGECWRHRLVAELLALQEDVAAPAGDSQALLAMALCHPRRPGRTDDDRAWSDAFRDVLDDALGTCWRPHLAAGGQVEPLTDVPFFLDRFPTAEDGDGAARRGARPGRRPSLDTWCRRLGGRHRPSPATARPAPLASWAFVAGAALTVAAVVGRVVAHQVLGSGRTHRAEVFEQYLTADQRHD